MKELLFCSLIWLMLACQSPKPVNQSDGPVPDMQTNPVHEHQAPDQEKIDSIKQLKTKEKK